MSQPGQENRAAFIGGVLHGQMFFVPVLDSAIQAPKDKNYDHKTQLSSQALEIVQYIRQYQYQFEALDGIETALYFTQGLDGRTVESLELDMLWPEGWKYARA